LTALIGGRRKGRKTHVGSSHRPPLVLCAESALSPSFSNNHPLSSFYTSYVDKSFIRTSFISFLFLHHRLGRRSSSAVPSPGPVPPQFPYPSLATILKHRSCPLLASSPSRVCSANPTNDITASAFFCNAITRSLVRSLV